MRKIINRPGAFVDEAMEGILFAHGERLRLLDGDARIVLRNPRAREGKVGIVTGGGSGHLPVFMGYVGEGMLDGCTIGNVFASPSARKMADTIRACDQRNGVLCLYGNYGGDSLNFDMACEMVDMEDGIRTLSVKVRDDVASSPKEKAEKRRGVAGMVYAFKIAGAAAERMLPLEAVAAAAEKALANIRTMGVALSACVVPEVGKPTFGIGENEMELGMGIHGEPGIEVTRLMTADEIADTILEKLLADMPLASGDEVSVMVNSLGATPMEELYIVYRRVFSRLRDMGVRVFLPHIGEFATSMEMAGLSITVFKLDAELKECLSSPASTPFYTNANGQVVVK